MPQTLPQALSASFPAECPSATSAWTWRDRLGAIVVRLGIRRMRYSVPPGLYALGRPTPESPVFVSANYKLSFDHLRRALNGFAGWILALDTKGVNVWCAAGEGKFSTDELVRCVRAAQLDQVVSHRNLILPQLSAPGVDAFAAAKQSGFQILYGPVYAEDLPRFLGHGHRATPDMRRVHFRWHERLAVAPLELVIHFKPYLLVGLAIAFLSGSAPSRFSWGQIATLGGPALAGWMVSYVLTGFLGPLLLPWLPSRSFAFKGAVLGAAIAAADLAVFAPAWPALRMTAWLLLVAAGASFLLLNFTGCTTFTSPSGVRREIRWALPMQAACAFAGLVAWTFTGWNGP